MDPRLKLLAERIEFVRKAGRVKSMAKWAEAAGFSRDQLTKFLRGRNQDIGFLTVLSLARVADLNHRWFLLGEGVPWEGAEAPAVVVTEDVPAIVHGVETRLGARIDALVAVVENSAREARGSPPPPSPRPARRRRT